MIAIYYLIFIGLPFWKAPWQKFYAVPQANLDASVEAESSNEELSPRSEKKINTELKEELTRQYCKQQFPILYSNTGVIRCSICQTHQATIHRIKMLHVGDCPRAMRPAVH